MEVTVVDVLKHAQNLLAQPGGWTKRSLAINKAGAAVSPQSEEAISFCASGAIIRSSKDLALGTGHATDIAVEAANALGFSSLGDLAVDFNDGRTSREPVLRAFARAIKKLEAVHG